MNKINNAKILLQTFNKTQLETADFAPVLPSGELNQTTLSDVQVVPPEELNDVIASGLFSPLHENMLPFTKPEVRSVSHYCQRMTEPRSQVTTNKDRKFHEIWFVWFLIYARGQTNKPTNRQAC